MIKELSKDYWLALQVSLVFQVVFMLLAGMILDGGQCAQWCAVSLAAYWGGLIVILLRRPKTPTRIDLFLIRWSFPAICFFITPFMMILVWKLRGVDF